MIQRRILQPLVESVTHAAANRSVLYKGVTLKAEKGCLTVYCRNAAYGLWQSAATGFELNIVQEGTVTVLADRFPSLIGKMTDGPIHLVKEEDALICNYGKKNKAKFKFLKEEFEWPITEECRQPVRLIRADKLARALRGVMNLALADSVTTSFQALKGVCMEYYPEEATLRFACTDRETLGMYEINDVPWDSAPFKAVLNREGVSDLLRLLGQEKENEILVGLENNCVVFTGTNFEFYTTSLSGNFPNYMGIVKPPTDNNFVIDKAVAEVVGRFAHWPHDKQEEEHPVVSIENDQDGKGILLYGETSIGQLRERIESEANGVWTVCLHPKRLNTAIKSVKLPATASLRADKMAISMIPQELPDGEKQVVIVIGMPPVATSATEPEENDNADEQEDVA